MDKGGNKKIIFLCMQVIEQKQTSTNLENGYDFCFHNQSLKDYRISTMVPCFETVFPV